MIDPSNNNVALVNKHEPSLNMYGYNLIGGKIEASDATAHDAMVREFQEETGILCPAWRSLGLCVLESGEVLLHIFSSVHSLLHCNLYTDKGEIIWVGPSHRLPDTTMKENINKILRPFDSLCIVKSKKEYTICYLQGNTKH